MVKQKKTGTQMNYGNIIDILKDGLVNKFLGRQVDRKAGRQVDSKTGTQVDRKAGIQVDRQTDRQVYMYMGKYEDQ